jgi:hypothetical protein
MMNLVRRRMEVFMLLNFTTLNSWKGNANTPYRNRDYFRGYRI